MIGASVKRCPECGGSGKVIVDRRWTFGVYSMVEEPCPRCDGAGAMLILDVQFDDEFPRHEEESNGSDD